MPGSPTPVMNASLRVGQMLKGKKASYTIQQQLFPTVWLATSSQSSKPMIVKSVRNWLIQNECNILKRFQRRAPSLRQLIDEIHEPNAAPAIVLQHFDADLLKFGAERKLSRSDVKMIAKEILKALVVLHENSFVHTDIKPDNILINWGTDGNAVTEATLSDCGTTVHKNSHWAKQGQTVGAPLWRSPEVTLGMRWGTPTDIWSFGATLTTLLMGNNSFLFKPDVRPGDASYQAKILENHCKYFGPSPLSRFNMSGTSEVLAALEPTMNNISAEQHTPIESIAEDKLSITDKIFISKIMKLDPKARPTAQQLLKDAWFETS